MKRQKAKPDQSAAKQRADDSESSGPMERAQEVAAEERESERGYQ